MEEIPEGGPTPAGWFRTVLSSAANRPRGSRGKPETAVVFPRVGSGRKRPIPSFPGSRLGTHGGRLRLADRGPAGPRSRSCQLRLLAHRRSWQLRLRGAGAARRSLGRYVPRREPGNEGTGRVGESPSRGSGNP